MHPRHRALMLTKNPYNQGYRHGESGKKRAIKLYLGKPFQLAQYHEGYNDAMNRRPHKYGG